MRKWNAQKWSRTTNKNTALENLWKKLAITQQHWYIINR